MSTIDGYPQQDPGVQYVSSGYTHQENFLSKPKLKLAMEGRRKCLMYPCGKNGALPKATSDRSYLQGTPWTQDLGFCDSKVCNSDFQNQAANALCASCSCANCD